MLFYGQLYLQKWKFETGLIKKEIQNEVSTYNIYCCFHIADCANITSLIINRGIMGIIDMLREKQYSLDTLSFHALYEH